MLGPLASEALEHGTVRDREPVNFQFLQAPDSHKNSLSERDPT
jgi:hypothetical protein